MLAIYGQDKLAVCKKLIDDTSKEMATGFVKYTSNVLISQAIQKGPPQVKAATVGAVFIAVSTDAALSIDLESLAYCIAAMNGALENYHLIGENGLNEDIH